MPVKGGSHDQNIGFPDLSEHFRELIIAVFLSVPVDLVLSQINGFVFMISQ